MSHNDITHYGLTVKTAPGTEPVTTAEAKDHARVDTADEDTLIDTLVTAARMRVEEYLQRALIDTTFTMTLDDFGPNVAWWPRSFLAADIRLPRNPVSSVDEIRYIDDSGTQQTLAASEYRVDTSSLVARLTPAYAETWPTTRPVTNAVEIDFTAGYGASATDVPAPIRQAIKIIVSTQFDYRQALSDVTVSEVPMQVEYLLGPYRVATHTGAL